MSLSEQTKPAIHVSIEPMTATKKTGKPKKTPRTTIASVNKEMQKPRLTQSVRAGLKTAVRVRIAL